MQGDGADLVDATLDLATQKLELFAQSDFVVCVLPGAHAASHRPL